MFHFYIFKSKFICRYISVIKKSTMVESNHEEEGFQGSDGGNEDDDGEGWDDWDEDEEDP